MKFHRQLATTRLPSALRLRLEKSSPKSRNWQLRRRGFSFVELMFAVMVLGIGFIMIAAVFPVGLQQTKLTLDESSAAGNARGIMSRLTDIAQTPLTDFALSSYIGGANIEYDQGQYITYNSKVYVCIVGYNTMVTATPNNDPTHWQVQSDTSHAFCIFPMSSYERRPSPAIGQRDNGIVRTLNDPRLFFDRISVSPSDAVANMRRYSAWQSVANEIISANDSRNATVILYKRDAVGVPGATGQPPVYAADTTAQVIAVNAQAASASAYGAADVNNSSMPPFYSQEIYNLEPRPVGVQIVYDATNGTYVATFFSVKTMNGGPTFDHGGYPSGTTGSTGANWDNILDSAPSTVAEGTCVIISDDRLQNGDGGRLNGHIFKTGNARPDLTGTSGSVAYVSYDLAPGYEFVPDPGQDGVPGGGDDILGVGVDSTTTTSLCGLTFSSTQTYNSANYNGSSLVMTGSGTARGAVALVLGRGFANSSTVPVSAAGYTGPTQDVAAYTTFVNVP